jgi:hypothetical protein
VQQDMPMNKFVTVDVVAKRMIGTIKKQSAEYQKKTSCSDKERKRFEVALMIGSTACLTGFPS